VLRKESIDERCCVLRDASVEAWGPRSLVLRNESIDERCCVLRDGSVEAWRPRSLVLRNESVVERCCVLRDTATEDARGTTEAGRTVVRFVTFTIVTFRWAGTKCLASTRSVT